MRSVFDETERDKPYARRKYPQNPAEHDFCKSSGRRTARRLIFASLARRAAACLRERGAEALWREASFRISLMTKGEVAFPRRHPAPGA